ncbi:MAG: hypothetical protein WD380_02655 [Gaiellaceae bacterium]
MSRAEPLSRAPRAERADSLANDPEVDHEETRPLDAHRFYGRLIAGARPIPG